MNITLPSLRTVVNLHRREEKREGVTYRVKGSDLHVDTSTSKRV